MTASMKGQAVERQPRADRWHWIRSLLCRYWEPVTVGVLFVLALLIRLNGIKWGLPNQNYPYSLFVADEPNILKATLLLGKRLYDVDVLRNQPFFYMAAFPAFVLYYLFLLATGRIDNLTDLEALYIQDNSDFLLVGRVFVAVIAALTVVLTYFVGKRMVDQRAGLFSALFLLFSFGHVVYSSVFRLDPFLPFLFLLAFYLILRLPDARPGKLRPHVLCGLVMGLAATTKITAFALLVPFIGSIILTTPGPRQWPPRLRDIDRRYPFAFTVFVATVVALTLPGYVYAPGIALHPVNRLDHSGASGYTASISPYGYSLPWHLSYILPRSVGLPIFIAGIAGLAVMVFDRPLRHKAILLLATMAAFILPIGYLLRTTWRDMLPMLPFFAIAGGYALGKALDTLFQTWPVLDRPAKRLTVSLALLTIILMLPIYEIAAYKRLIKRDDTRDIAKEWIEEMIPTGSRLAIESYGPGVRDRSVEELAAANLARLGRPPAFAEDDRPIYDVYLLNLDMSNGRDTLRSGQLPNYLVDNRIDYVVLSSGYYGRFYNDAVDVVFPQRAAASREFYDLIDGSLVLAAQFVPDWDDTPGPVIKIYEVPDDMRQEAEPASGHFEPYPDLDRPASVVGYYQFSPR